MGASSGHGKDSPAVGLKGELIAQNGRLKGTRRDLQGPITFIGKSVASDIRLNVNGISPLHCLVVRSGDQIILRDLESNTGTFVNGQRVSDHVLQSNDQLMVGPFQFLVQITKDATAEKTTPPPDDGRSREVAADSKAKKFEEALRIQAAAVAAQQAALTEFESRLNQRESTLQKQQEQLAAHLEKKRERLLQLHAETTTAKEDLRLEKEEYERHVEEFTRELTKNERELVNQKHQVEAERKRLFHLRQRMIQRFRRRCRQQREQLEGREQDLEKTLRWLERDLKGLEHQKSDFTDTCLKFNSDLELGRRKLQLEWNRFYEERRLVRKRLQERLTQVEEREARLIEAERLLEDEREKSQRHLEDCKFEAEGLQTRIRNQRRMLADLRHETELLQRGCRDRENKWSVPLLEIPAEINEAAPKTYPLAAPPPNEWLIEFWLARAAPAAVAPRLSEAESPWQQQQEELEILAGELSDQRLALAEHLEQLVHVQQCWRHERDKIQKEILSVLEALQQHGHLLLAKESEIEPARQELQRRDDELMSMRQELIGWQGRMRAREIEIDAVQERKQSELAAQEQLLQQQKDALAALHQDWTNSRQEELQSFLATREMYERAAQEYVALTQQRRQELLDLEEAKRGITKKALAIEQLRQESLKQVKEVPGAERRMQHLQRRWALEESEGLRLAKRQLEELQYDLAQLQAHNRELEQQHDQLTKENHDLSQQRIDWQQQQLQVDAEQARLRRQLQLVEEKRRLTEKRLAEMHDEVDRVARHLMAEESTVSPLLPTRIPSQKEAARMEKAA